MKTILILGAGIGGVVAAHELKKRINKSEPFKVILFEKEPEFTFAPSLPWLMVGKRKSSQLKNNISSSLHSNLEIVYGTIQNIDTNDLSVSVNNQKYFGDYIIIALGAETKVENELDNFGFNFYSLKSAESFNKQLENFESGKIVFLIPSLPFKCPAAPYEAVLLAESFIRKKGNRDKTEISFYTPEPFPLPVAGKSIGEEVIKILEMKKINYFPNHQLTSATNQLLKFSNDTEKDFDLLAFTPKHFCPGVLTDTGLIGKNGWVDVDRNTLETNHKNIFAIGDVTSIPLEMGKPLPKAGVFAHLQAEVVAHNILEKINGTQNYKSFDGFGECFMEVGNFAAGYAKGNFYASPLPNVKMKKPSFRWHLGKVWFEKYWWYKYF